MIGPLRGALSPLGVSLGAAAPWWYVPGQTCVAAYKPIGAASLATSYINLANPGTYNAAPGVAPTLGAGGWTFDGVNDYLTTGIVPDNNQQWSVLVRYENAAASDNSILFGSANISGPPYFGVYPRPASFNTSYQNGYYLLVGTSQAAGVVAVAGNKPYRDGSAQSGTISASAGTFNAIFLGARNTGGGTPGSYFSGTIAALAIYSGTLSAADVAALTTRMQALA
jgi:hypothetical protein